MCFNRLKDQIFITDQKRFFDSLLEMECFNSKMKGHTHCIDTMPVHCIDAMFSNLMTVHEIYYGCLTQCCKRFLFNDFYVAFRMKALHEIIIVSTVILMLFMNGEDYCVSLSVLYLVFILLIGCILFFFQKKLRNYN